MTATEKLKQNLIFIGTKKVVTDPQELDAAIEAMGDECDLSDLWELLRCSGHVTGLDAPYSRHYESKAVAAQMLDGSWVGWTYWYGGGKHGEPSLMPWVEDAYDVVMEEVMQPVKVFKRV